jgi:chemotaxis protein CheD
MNDIVVQHVNAGDLSIGRGDEVFSALLGSCVGIGLIWRAGGVCGLAHCLLPAPSRPVIGVGARYVSQAVPLLLKMMDIPIERRGEVEVALVGGASMLGRANVGYAIGRANIAMAQAVLTSHGLHPAHLDVGGRRARRIRLDCARHSFSIISIEAQEHVHAHH